MGKGQSRKRQKHPDKKNKTRKRAHTIGALAAASSSDSSEILDKSAFNQDTDVKKREEEIHKREEEIRSKIAEAKAEESGVSEVERPVQCVRIERRYRRKAKLVVNPKHYEKPPPSLCEIGNARKLHRSWFIQTQFVNF
jgi:hypothetical protein